MSNPGEGKMDIVQIKIADLIHPEYNPRQISEKDFEQLKKSLSGFGAVEPAVINQHPARENIIVGGNQRIRAAQALGWDEYPCYLVNLPEERERELNIRLNKNTGDWDTDKLANDFDAADLISWGFSFPEIVFSDENADGDGKRSRIKVNFEIPPNVWLDSGDKLKNSFDEIADCYGIEIIWPK